MLCNLHYLLLAVEFNGQRFIDLRQLAAAEFDVNNRTKHLRHSAFQFHALFLAFYARRPSA